MWPGHPPLEEGNRRRLHHVDYLFSVLTISDLTVAKVTFLEGAETGSCGVLGGGRREQPRARGIFPDQALNLCRSAMEAWSLNYWTAREVQGLWFDGGQFEEMFG